MTSSATRVAIVGAGPAGFFAAEALLKSGDPVAIDFINRLPAPYGLVRDGVAPDHQAIKSVARVYAKILARGEVRYFGNVTLGKDISVDELRARYDQIVYAVGAQSARRLGIPGEDLSGSHAAFDFVAWYNAHPEFREAHFDLDCEHVVVIGNGNVAIDVARILVLSLDRLAKTDIADHALEALRGSRVRRVTLLGRRGPAQASFTNPELREFGRLDGVCAEVDGAELELDAASEAEIEGNAVRTRNMATLRGYAESACADGERVVRFRFLVSPLELVGEGGRVTGVRIERNRLEAREDGYLRAVGTGETEVVPCGMVIRSVGYRGVPLPGVPFDERRGT
ncbi:MAG: NADP oxidoreductase, partial [Gemmatimonadetes bacterium]|nr:NADP oxidoreductase [Gemmatimonadota bacterium]MYI47106.1 NADP oxidoreductase [Gemmatimonadota bacterium]